MSTKTFICGNWKMFKTQAETRAYFAELLPLLKAHEAALAKAQVQVGVAVPFTLLPLAASLAGPSVVVASQDVYWESQGAFTGEVSAAMVKDTGATHGVVGHSERRQFFGDTDENVGKKAKALTDAGLIPIVCVGETLAERDAGQTLAVVSRQLKAGCTGLDPARLVVAYEPVWAIGTGKTATPQMAEEVHVHIRALLRELFGNAADGIVIQYGGSVKPDNAVQLLSEPNIGGALVGGASLKPSEFIQIVAGAIAAS